MTQGQSLNDNIFRHPLLLHLNDLARELAGIDMLLIYPKSDGWGQVAFARDHLRPDFCRTIQSSADGARSCRMCHILMAVAACSNKEQIEQTCHAGASVLVSPVKQRDGSCFAVLSSCVFFKHRDPHSWQDVKERGQKLGVRVSVLQDAYDSLPKLTNAQIASARLIMHAVGETVRLIRSQADAESRVAELEKTLSGTGVAEAVQQELRTAGTPAANPAKSTCACAGKPGIPPLIRVVTELVSRKPNLSYSVAEIASAARISPNYFSALFQKYRKQSFSDFLADQRIEMAKRLLADLSLNMAEVSRMAGYDDPAYFARRFRQKTGRSPSEWRDRLEIHAGG